MIFFLILTNLKVSSLRNDIVKFSIHQCSVKRRTVTENADQMNYVLKIFLIIGSAAFGKSMGA